jgi:hypothetical protein
MGLYINDGNPPPHVPETIIASILAEAAWYFATNETHLAHVGECGACRIIEDCPGPVVSREDAGNYFTDLFHPTEAERKEYRMSIIMWLREREPSREELAAGKGTASYMQRLKDAYTVRVIALQLAALIAEEEGV